ALQASFTLRNRRGWSSMVNYTWSHSIDNASDGQDYVANATQPDDSFRTDHERGNSNFDTRPRCVWTFSYYIPSFAPSHPRLGEGWQLNGVLTLRSGNPFHLNYNFTGDFNGTGEFSAPPAPVCD